MEYMMAPTHLMLAFGTYFSSIGEDWYLWIRVT
ncbi:MAG: hypothetical protein DK304_001187 [Chloroflexi bacterium]|jgi:hypothetical protein|nr:MAG: hypothetical protein DK304_001187 [Chloroflexota bacterium]